MFRFDLQFFADAPASASAPAAAPAQGAGDSAAPKSQPVVLYGKQDVAEDSAKAALDSTKDVSSNTLDAKKKAFEDLIGGEYKDLFTERVNNIVNRRFKEVKGMEDRLTAVSPILQILGEKYRIDGNDPDKIAKAIEADDAYWEEAAEAAGQTVEQYKYVKKLERENAEILAKQKAQKDAEDQKRFMDETFQRWTQEEAEARQAYPTLELKTELQNPAFARLLQSGVPVMTAYEVTHINDVKSGVAKATAQRVERNVTQNIRTRGQRPQENGLASGAGIVIKSDVKNLTKQDRAEIARRSLRGEKITF